MTLSLLNRQEHLLNYLTSSAAIFGSTESAPINPALDGIEIWRLRLEARFSHEKRIEKVASTLPRTLSLLGDKRVATIAEFTEAHPPVSISRIDNAEQFYNFLLARSQGGPFFVPYLLNVAAFELALARFASAEELHDELHANTPAGTIRRHRKLILLRCAYNIRPFFEVGITNAPEERDTPLVMYLEPETGLPEVFEAEAWLFNLLATLDDWTDYSSLGTQLVTDLLEYGLIEVNYE